MTTGVDRYVDVVVDLDVDVDVDESSMSSVSPSTHSREHLNDSSEEFARLIGRGWLDEVEGSGRVYDGSALHRGAAGDRVEPALVGTGGLPGTFRDVEDDRKGRAADLIREAGVGARESVRDLNGDRQEAQGLPIDVEIPVVHAAGALQVLDQNRGSAFVHDHDHDHVHVHVFAEPPLA